ncbi:hypothetical protein BASA81_015057 [Batrachochytrium salamandrivorans]|nr:hypothetical protein BASA81_015057 [Batrachochytrium salamandrivorans]
MKQLAFLPFGSNEVTFQQSNRDTDEEEPNLQRLRSQIFVCRVCHAHLASGGEICSRDFHGASGKAYLFNTAINTSLSNPEQRRLRTGMHTVTDAACVQCGNVVGWRYVAAVDTSQQYKVGKFVLELSRVRRRNNGRNRVDFDDRYEEERRTSSSSGSSMEEDDSNPSPVD